MQETMQEMPVWSLGKVDPLERAWPPSPVHLPGESHGQGARWATVHGVTKSWTWPKPLSMRIKMKGKKAKKQKSKTKSTYSNTPNWPRTQKSPSQFSPSPNLCFWESLPLTLHLHLDQSLGMWPSLWGKRLGPPQCPHPARYLLKGPWQHLKASL